MPIPDSSPYWQRRSSLPQGGGNTKRTNSYRRAFGIAAAAVLLAGSLSACGADLAIGGLVLGDFLDKLTKDVSDTLSEAQNDASGLLTQAASAVGVSIDQARVAYEDSLDKTVKTTESAVVTVTGNLQVAVSDLETRASEDLADAQKKATETVLLLPFSDGQPQITSWTPEYSDGSRDLTLVIKGIFTQAGRPGSVPQLTIGGSTLNADDPGNANPTQIQIFTIKKDLLPVSKEGVVQPVTASLTVPYHSTVLRRDQTAHYALWLGILPPSPGTVYLRHIVHNPHLVRGTPDPLTSTTFSQGGVDHDITQTYCTNTPPTGWNLVTPGNATDEVVVTDQSSTSKQGSNWTVTYDAARSDANRYCFDVWTQGYQNGIGGHHSAAIRFYLRWSIEHTVDDLTWSDDLPPIALHWGDEQAFDISSFPPGGWLVIYQPFDSGSTSMGSPQTARWVTMTQDVGHVYVKAMDPGAVRF